MRICMVVPNPTVKGGIASVVNGYRDHGFPERIRVTYVESYCNGSKWAKLSQALAAYRHFFKVLRRNPPQIVHIHSSFGPSFFRKIPFILMAKNRGIPIINHIHGAEFDPFYTHASAGKKKLIGRIYNKCDALIALSDDWKNKLQLLVPPDKITVIGNYTVIPPAHDRVNDEQILFLGEIGERKGCFDIPAILELVKANHGNVQMVVAGDGQTAKMKALLQDRQLADAVSFPGWVRNEAKKRLLQESGIFLFPSYFEGMPMAVLEAMAYGLAIVTTNVGGIPDLIQDGVNGYLYQPGDINGMAEGVVKLLDRPELRKTLAGQARADAIARYGIDNHIGKLLSLYEKTAGKAAGPQ